MCYNCKMLHYKCTNESVCPLHAWFVEVKKSEPRCTNTDRIKNILAPQIVRGLQDVVKNSVEQCKAHVSSTFDTVLFRTFCLALKTKTMQKLTSPVFRHHLFRYATMDLSCYDLDMSMLSGLDIEIPYRLLTSHTMKPFQQSKAVINHGLPPVVFWKNQNPMMRDALAYTIQLSSAITFALVKNGCCMELIDICLVYIGCSHKQLTELGGKRKNVRVTGSEKSAKKRQIKGTK